ncbi:methyltransferase domain-containing protein [Microtetraspora sp. NBRC 16547]|uniref:class I SAM-dependent methyltransferase n=1 Tax=Microtetraspora sp. NBRC 16547 TaxID=3030993 RepID=UPI0024A0B841|nr:methyltransferase domain-containing protein [Microtetraspora sp. NBRC 16547]GLW96268.1 methyltransferase [Microtetraspora sp. NBRC 16547]
MDLEAFRELLTSEGRTALAEAVRVVAEGLDPVAAATRLRRAYDPALTSAALTQAALRRRGEAKFGADAAVMYFTPHGLEQATRAEVAAHRARRVAGAVPARAAGTAETAGFARAAAAAGPRVLDVCCGIGGDLIALARAGCAVDAVDLDPLTAEVARANTAALGLADLAEIRTADAADTDPSAYDVLFADPARRGARGRVFDPMAYSPSWPATLDLASRAPAACLKVAPGIPYELIPEGAEAEWVSYKGEVKEAAIWLGGLARSAGDESGGFARRATLLPSGETLVPSGAEAGTGPVARYLYEPDGAAVRAHLVAEVADMVKGHLLDPRIAYITSDELVRTPWAAAYEVHEVMPFSLKALRAALRKRGVGNVTIKKRGSAVDIDQLSRNLRLSGDNSAVIVLTRIAERPYALICQTMSASRP